MWQENNSLLTKSRVHEIAFCMRCNKKKEKVFHNMLCALYIRQREQKDTERVITTRYKICALFTKCYGRVQVKRTW
jgi:hypothetical protein